MPDSENRLEQFAKNRKDEQANLRGDAPVKNGEVKRGKKSTKQGRPKGAETVARSVRVRKDINDRLVAKQVATHMPYNEIVNLALDSYLK